MAGVYRLHVSAWRSMPMDCAKASRLPATWRQRTFFLERSLTVRGAGAYAAGETDASRLFTVCLKTELVYIYIYIHHPDSCRGGGIVKMRKLGRAQTC